ncbi:hypothetical protein AB833_06885 [Chromatiales bacterium (ex Bugula neritina AB1)]|nr:hypothetical protein AB833_06885 [Chromatiales bacterium (ex Bugula neritina AB1)]
MRKLAIAAAVSIGLGSYSVNSLALGLGDIEMYSALNQPLDAEIGILAATPAELEGLSVTMAPHEAFSRAGLDRLPVLSALRFRVERRPDGVPVVKVTSDVPVVEPFLNFLLNVDTQLGQRLVREYTVLLDPPVFAAQRSQSGIDNIAESTAIDIEKEIGASTVIDRVAASTAVVADSAGTGHSAAMDLSSEVMPAPVVSNSVDLSAGDPVAINIDDVASPGSAEQMVARQLSEASGGAVAASDDEALLSDVSQGEVVAFESVVVPAENMVVPAESGPDAVEAVADVIFNSDAETQTPDQARDGGQLIALESELVGDVVAETRVLDSGGVSLSLNNLGEQGAPIFEPDAVALLDTYAVDLSDNNAGSVAGGLEVDLSELLPVALPADQDQAAGLENDGGTPVEIGQQESVPSEPVQSITVAANADTTDLGEEVDLSGIIESLPSAVAQSNFAPAATDDYTVRQNDTLWSIARRNKPKGYSTQQMMVALLRTNEGAFVAGDMNKMRNGSTLSMPAMDVIAQTDGGAALAIVREQIERQPPVALPEPVAKEVSESATSEAMIAEQKPLSIVGVDETISETTTPATDQSSAGSEVARDLDEVNRRMQLAQEELASESMQRDELRGRVNELEDSMGKMKRLITLRESELSELQTELITAKSDTTEAAAEAEEKARMLAQAQLEKNDMQKRMEEMQEKITAGASQAQERIDQQADADKNLASAEAQALSVRLATEEDTIRAQLAALQEEKKALMQTAQDDKVELVRQAEAEKSELLAQAKAERERIMAELESEKLRITEQAAADRQRIADEARLEKERLIAEATAEREKLAVESEAMRVRLEALEEEKANLLAAAELDKTQLEQAAQQAEQALQEAEEQKRLQAEAQAEKMRVEEESQRVKERLAELQAEATANLASSGETVSTIADGGATTAVATTIEAVAGKTASVSLEPVTDAVDNTVEIGAAGTAAAGGLLAAAPLQRELGDRKTVLATGGVVALLGLLGAWAMRRRKPVVKEDIDFDQGREVPRTMFDNRPANLDSSAETQRNSMASAAVAASAAAAAGGVAATHGTEENQPELAERNIGTAAQAETEQVDSQQQPAAVTEAVAAADNDNELPAQSSRLSDAELMDDSTLLDDTITEAEVYLRYGLHGQAEDLLQTAIERSPDNEDYQFKLLENYHDQKNVQGFQSAASTFRKRFEDSPRWERVAEMGRDLESGNTLYSRVTALDTDPELAAAGAAAIDDDAALLNKVGDHSTDDADGFDIDATIDPNAEFNLSDLEATGQFETELTGLADDNASDLGDLGDVTLDEVDLAALDDDGTLNLEELAGNQMSGLDLGSLDLTNPDNDSTLDNLTLDDADLNSLGDVTSSLRNGLEADFSSDDLDGGLEESSDEMETMLDLAKAYIDMGDTDSAASALKDIADNGNAAQKLEATELLKGLT